MSDRERKIHTDQPVLVILKNRFVISLKRKIFTSFEQPWFFNKYDSFTFRNQCHLDWKGRDL